MKIKFLVSALAIAGVATVVQSAIIFPSAPGLFIYDTASGMSTYQPIVGNAATFVGTVGDYSVNIAAQGVTLAGGASPIIDLNLNAQAGSGATTLQVFYSDGIFGPTTGAFVLSSLGPLFGGPVTTSAFMDNVAFGQSTLLASHINGGYEAGLVNGNSYYLTLETLISGSAIGVNSGLQVLAVPEPSEMALMLLGGALTCIGIIRRKHAA